MNTEGHSCPERFTHSTKEGLRGGTLNLMRRRTPQHFYAFDILWLDGKDLRWVPLVNRKQILRRVVPRIPL